MFYQVKVLDPKGNIKKVISSKALSNRFWKDQLGESQGGSDVRANPTSDTEFDLKGNDLPLSD